jgi:hypothetical protein
MMALVDEMGNQHIQEIRSLARPPAGVPEIVVATMILLGQTDRTRIADVEGDTWGQKTGRTLDCCQFSGLRPMLQEVLGNLDTRLTEQRVKLMREAIPPGSAAEDAERMHNSQQVAGWLCEIKDLVLAWWEMTKEGAAREREREREQKDEEEYQYDDDDDDDDDATEGVGEDDEDEMAAAATTTATAAADADAGAGALLPIATLICVPGAGVAGAAAAAGISDRAGGPGLWSTKKLLTKRGPEVATTAPYHAWAEQHGVLAMTLSSNSPDAIASALTACSGPVLFAAHSEGGASLIEVAKKRAADLRFLAEQRGVRVCGAALLDSVHKGPLPGAAEADDAAEAEALLRASVTCAFVSSSKPLGDRQPKPWVKDGLMHGCPTVSAGTTEHLLVPHAAQAATFEFFERQLEAVAAAAAAGATATATTGLLVPGASD